MAINPIAFARTVNEQFLRYQFTAFPITDEKLARPSLLIKGPYPSPAKALRIGPPRRRRVLRGGNETWKMRQMHQWRISVGRTRGNAPNEAFPGRRPAA